MKIYERVNKLLGTEFENNKSIDWDRISIYCNLSEDFIKEFQNKVDWDYISIEQKLSENFIRELKDKVEWTYISIHQKLSECFIREFQNRVDWDCISKYQKLSESFIREFQDKVNWNCISQYQKLSENFIREFLDKLDWDYISKYQKLSDEFISEFTNMLDHKLINDSWLYKSSEEKKQAVIDTGLYECHDDYFIAYKGIRSNRYSAFNFQYKYEPGGIYESWCDCSDEENSSGLSVWTKIEAWGYCNELVVKVKIYYEDVGRVVHDGGKVRCFRFEVLD